ncbi:MAG TPA: class I SAM-dependent methyltransferase [Thermoplasmata archaeon]|nr:class I SAM-dependent methyltransferase [Thermoplasmata archaeon]
MAEPRAFAVDEEAERAVYGPMSRVRAEFLPDPAGKTVVDVGGGNGNFAFPYALAGARVIVVDLDRRGLQAVPPPAHATRASLLRLPLRDASVDAVIGRAILHHVPDALPGAVDEIHRVLRPGGGLLIQEPCAGNLPAAVARRYVPTERHEPGERVLPLRAYVDAIAGRLEVRQVLPHFLISYLLPHAVSRLAPGRRGMARRLTALSAWADAALLAKLPHLDGRAAYVSVVARKPA